MHRENHKHVNKFYFNPGEVIGLEINFVFDVERICLYKASFRNKKLTIKNIKLVSLEKIYDRILSKHTQKVVSVENCLQVRERIKLQLLQANKKIAAELVRKFSEDNNYYELLILNNFLLAFLSCGGFGVFIQEMLLQTLTLHDVVNDFQSYVDHAHYSRAPARLYC